MKTGRVVGKRKAYLPRHHRRGSAFDGARADRGTMASLAQKIPLPVAAVGGAVVAVFALLKLKNVATGGGFADEQARYRKCNRCAKKGAGTRCTRCRRAWYCSPACLKAAWKLEICECC